MAAVGGHAVWALRCSLLTVKAGLVQVLASVHLNEAGLAVLLIARIVGPTTGRVLRGGLPLLEGACESATVGRGVCGQEACQATAAPPWPHAAHALPSSQCRGVMIR